MNPLFVKSQYKSGRFHSVAMNRVPPHGGGYFTRGNHSPLPSSPVRSPALAANMLNPEVRTIHDAEDCEDEHFSRATQVEADDGYPGLDSDPFMNEL